MTATTLQLLKLVQTRNKKEILLQLDLEAKEHQPKQRG
jgi:hypothetical protein